MEEIGIGQNVKPMEVKRVSLDEGVAAMTRNTEHGTENYVPAAHLAILTPQETYYNLWIAPRGLADTLAGEMSRDRWNQRDTLLQLTKDETVDGETKTSKITTEEASRIRTVLNEIREGKQNVTETLLTAEDDLTEYERQHPDETYNKRVEQEFVNKVVSFLEPRIEIAAKKADEHGEVELGVVDNELGEKRELDRPPTI